MEETTRWRVSATHPPLLPGQVHLWRLSLLADPEEVAEYGSLLSEDEQKRAGRFHFERDRRRYTVARGALRQLLAAYLRQDARSLRFAYGPQGKPSLSPAEGAMPLAFNLSHSGEMAVFAFCLQGRVGVDIEERRALDDLRSLAASVFSQRELADLHSLSPDQQQSAFYACWTRKEAFIKAIGDGLSYPLARFDVSLLPGEAAQLLRVEGEPDPQTRWQMAAFLPRRGYAGTLVVEGEGASLSFWRCTGPTEGDNELGLD